MTRCEIGYCVWTIRRLTAARSQAVSAWRAKLKALLSDPATYNCAQEPRGGVTAQPAPVPYEVEFNLSNAVTRILDSGLYTIHDKN